MAGFPPMAREALASVRLPTSGFELRDIVVEFDGFMAPDFGARYWPGPVASSNADHPWLARARNWRCRFHPDRGVYRLTVRDWGARWSHVQAKWILWHPLSLAVAHEGGRFVHGASLVQGSRAVLFVGNSGAGKTTLASRVPVEQRLGDDVAVLLPRGGRLVAVPSPFSGRERLAAGAGSDTPVGAIAFVVPSSAERLERLSLGVGVEQFVRFLSPPSVPWARERTLDLVAALARLPLFRLHHTLATDPLAIMTAMLS